MSSVEVERVRALLGDLVITAAEVDVTPPADEVGAVDGGEWDLGGGLTLRWYSFASYDSAMALAEALAYDPPDGQRATVNGALLLIALGQPQDDRIGEALSRFAGQE